MKTSMLSTAATVATPETTQRDYNVFCPDVVVFRMIINLIRDVGKKFIICPYFPRHANLKTVS